MGTFIFVYRFNQRRGIIKIWETLMETGVNRVAEILADEILATEAQTGQCIRPFAVNAIKNAKCPLGQPEAGRFFAKIVFRTIGLRVQ